MRVAPIVLCVLVACHASPSAPTTDRAVPSPLSSASSSPSPSSSTPELPRDAAAASLPDASEVVASAAVDAGSGPVDLDAFIKRWNADVPSAEYRLSRPAGAPYEFPIGKLWCSLKLAAGPKGVITRATLEHAAKATLKWSCKFAEKAMLTALAGDPKAAASILERLELPDTGKATRSVTEGTLRITRRNDEGNGDVTAVVSAK